MSDNVLASTSSGPAACGSCGGPVGPAAVSLAPIHRRQVVLHGQPMSYLESGSGSPTVVLIHGLAGDGVHWRGLIALLGQHLHVLAPDLLGHGESAAPADADYSVSAHASRLRDMLRVLGHHRVNLVGHSLGGGVAMAFAYQFPERTDTLTLIASGGLGPELHLALRLGCLPGVFMAAHTLYRLISPRLARLAYLGVALSGLASTEDLHELGGALRALGDGRSRRAILHTLRSVAGWAGQHVDARDRLHLLAGLPVLLIVGDRDRCIPYQHTVAAQRFLPGSRLEVLAAGHFPHHEYPDQVGASILDLLRSGCQQPASRPSSSDSATA